MKRILISLAAVALSISAQTPSTITLADAVREAVNNNLDVAAARYNISVAEARQITAALRPNPVLTLAGDHLNALPPLFTPLNNGGPNEASFRVDFVLERGGKREARIDLAAQDKSLAELDFRDGIRRLIFDVQSSFVDVQSAEQNLALARDNLASLNGITAINTTRVQSGDLAAVELYRSQVAALQYQTAVRQAELQVRQAKNKLQLLLGRVNVTDDFDVTGPIRRDEQPVALEEIRGRAQAQRPDLLSVRRAQARNQSDLRLQIAQGKIDYTAGTEYRRQQGVSGTANTMGFFFSAPLPIFNKNQGEIARAQHEIDHAAASLRAVELRIGSETMNAWQQYSASRNMLEEIEKNMLTKASEVRQITEFSYRRGEASLVEFLDAQRAFNETMQSYNTARADYARSLYLIDSVTATSLP